jgi:hypothetical protein
MIKFNIELHFIKFNYYFTVYYFLIKNLLKTQLIEFNLKVLFTSLSSNH